MKNKFRILKLLAALPVTMIPLVGEAQTSDSLTIEQAVELRFKTSSGKTYTLEASDDFGQWKTIGGTDYGNGRTQKRFLSVDDANQNLKFFRLNVSKNADVGFAPTSLVGNRFILNTGGFPQTVEFLQDGLAERASANGTDTVAFLYSKTSENKGTLEIVDGERRLVYSLEFTGLEAGAFRLETMLGDRIDDIDVGTFTLQSSPDLPPVPGGNQLPPVLSVPHAGVAKSDLSGLSFVFNDGGEPIWLQFEDAQIGRVIDDGEIEPFNYFIEGVTEAEQKLRIDFGNQHGLELHLAYSGECSGTYIMRETEGGDLEDVDMGTFSVSTEPIDFSAGGDDDEGDHDGDDDDEGDHEGDDDDEGDHDGDDDDEGDHEGDDDDEGDHDGDDDDEGDHDGDDDDEGDHDGDDDDEGDHDGDDDDEGDHDGDDDDEGDHDGDDDDEGDHDGDDDDEGDHDGDDDDEGDHDGDDDDEGDHDGDDDDEGDHDGVGEGESEESQDSDEEDGDVYPLVAILSGTANSDKLQGFESDDHVTGGAGSDLFPLTLGSDLIVDFNPIEDVIDVGDFGRASDGFEVLTSLASLAANSEEVTDEFGVPSLVIDVDGDAGDSSTTLAGVTLADLNEGNVFFGLGGDSIPPLEFTHIAETLVTYSNGDVILFPAHDLDHHPVEGRLISQGIEKNE